MAHLTIRVPEPHVAALRRELMRAYEEREQSGASVEADDLHEALEQLPEGAGGDVAVTAHPEVLSDAVHALLGAALGELSAIVGAYWRGADAGAAVGERLAAVSSLVALFRSVQDG
jgi:hypothetical protein